MVTAVIQTQVRPATVFSELPENEIKHCIVPLSEIVSGRYCLDASYFNIIARQAAADVQACRFPKAALIDGNSFVRKAHYGGRLKRNYIAKICNSAIGFIGSSEMLDTNPKPVKFMDSTSIDADSLRLKKDSVLISRSGTIGKLTYVNDTLSNLLVSEHAIRLECADNISGYVFAFLKSRIGQALVQSKIFGAVVQEIEPEHLANIPIPNPPNEIKSRINDLIVHSFGLRDKSNDLIDKATASLADELCLPPIDKVPITHFSDASDVSNYTVKLSDLSGRLDGSYHVPIARAIEGYLRQHAMEVLTVGDARVSKNIVLPGRFKRLYVAEGQGRVFFGGKQIGELDPSNKKYLSTSCLSANAKTELEILENTTLITRSGTIGRVAIAPRHWGKWMASEHIIRVFPASDSIAGFLYIFLASEYGHSLITRFTYGSVVDEIDANHVSRIPFPILKNTAVQDEINTLALKANSMRSDAYELEQRAIKLMNDEVIYAR